MKTLSLIHAGWIAENYHTGEKSKVYYSQVTAKMVAILYGSEWSVRRVKAPSAISAT